MRFLAPSFFGNEIAENVQIGMLLELSVPVDQVSEIFSAIS